MRTALLVLTLAGATSALAEPPAITPVPRTTIYL